MQISFTNHALRKREFLKELGWGIDLKRVEHTIKSPDLSGKTKYDQDTAVSFLDKEHILRVVYKTEGGKITVITFHVSKKGRYGT